MIAAADILARLEPTSGDWADPDASLIDEGLSPAPVLNAALLGSWGQWVSDYADMKSAPAGYVLGAVLAAAAALIGASRKVEAKPGWHAFPALWVLLVGKPSASKSPVLAPIMAMLRDLERDEAEGFDVQRRTFETDRQAAKETLAAWEGEVKAALKQGNLAPLKPAGADEPDEPKPPRIVVSDATIEAMAPVLNANPRGVILARDELAGFVGNIGKYGGDGDAAFWLERYDGAGFSVDRVKAGHVQGDVGLVSVIGGIQPDRLADVLFKRADDGFVCRFLMIYPDPVRRERVTPVADMGKLKRALERLRALPLDTEDGRSAPRVIPLSPAAADVFFPWWQDNGDDGEAAGGYQAGMLGKAPGVVLRLALILEYLDWAVGHDPEPAAVSLVSVAAAIALYEDYLFPSACRVFGGAAREKGDMIAATLAKQIRHRRARTINARTIRREWGLSGLTTANAVNEALGRLEAAGWVRRIGGREGDTPGRERADWEVNPKLWEAGS